MTEVPRVRPAHLPRHLVLLLAAYVSLMVATTDVYLPVLPQLGADLGTTSSAAAGTLSAALVGVAVGQIIFGPLSDAVGRRVPLLVGALAYAAMHLVCAVAPSIQVLIGLRGLAGLATAACTVVVRAIVPDVYPGVESAKAFALLGAVMSIAPVVAPLVGGALAEVMSWRGMFVVLAGLALILAVVGWRAIPETLPPERRVPAHPVAVFGELASVMSRRRFLAYVAVAAGVGGALFGYIGASSFVLQNSYGLSPQQYSVVFAVNATGILGCSWATHRLVERVGPTPLLRLGQAVAVVGAAVLAIGVATSVLAIVLAGLFCVVASLGLVMPTGTALGMDEAAGRAGSASGAMGTFQFTVGAICAPLAGLGGSPGSMVVVIAASAVFGLAARLALTTPLS